MNTQKSLSIQSGLHISQNEKNEGNTRKTFKEKIRTVFSNITVEPILLMYEIPSYMVVLTAQNLNLEKACRVNLQFESRICDSMTSRNTSDYSANEEIQVQKLVASMNAWKNALQSFFPVVLLIFIGAWSDRNKRRKPCIILPMLGESVSAIGFIICTYFFYELSMEWNGIVEAIPFALTGGWFTMFTAVYSYISNISDLESRTLRIGAVSICDKISSTAGIAVSGIAISTLGFYGVFVLAMVLYTIGILYGVFYVKEVPRDDVPPRTKGWIRDFFDADHFVDTVKVVFKKGKRNRRPRILLLMISLMVIIGPFFGEYNVMYLFVRYKFGWNEIDYSMFTTFALVVNMIGTALSLTLFSRILKVDDAVLGLISNFSKIASCFIYAFAPTPTIFYLGIFVEMMNGTSFIAIRSLISKLVPQDELGKVNSFFGVCEALAPLLYGPVYSYIYRQTINWLPGFFFIMGGFLTLPSVFTFLWVYRENLADKEEIGSIEEQKPMGAN